MKKDCVVCGSSFVPRTWNSTLCSSECKKEKRIARQKKHYEENKEKIKARCKKDREKNPAKRKKYREKNLEKIRARCKKYRGKNLEKIKAMQKRWYKENKEKISVAQKEYKKKIFNQTPAVVYMIECSAANKYYIGQTSVSFAKRISNHRSKFKYKRNSCGLGMQEDYNTYGPDAFKYSILRELDPQATEEELLTAEAEFIDKFLREDKELYNKCQSP